jgi:acetyl esterase/lipase
MVHFPAKQGMKVKGAVLIAPGGGFRFRSANEGAPVARALGELGYQSFVVNYRLRPYSMQEGALDLGRAVRYVRDHAADYGIDEQDIAVVGFSAGGILWGELLLDFDGAANGTSIDPGYVPDDLDRVSADASAVGMIYSFYGRLSVASTDVEKFKTSALPPAFFAYGTRDPFVREFEKGVEALRRAGVPVEEHVLPGAPHGFGAGDGQWIRDFDRWATSIFAPSTAGSNQKGSGRMASNAGHLSTSSTIGDVVNHPAFRGFGQFVLPLDRGSYDDAMPLQNVASLLPYHSNVDPSAAVGTINYLVDEATSGRTIFYDVYTDAQKQADPAKRSTGLFFFRGKPGAPFAVVSPGGGFSYVGSVHEGFPYAIALSQKGYNAFVLQYRVGGERVATEDLAAALSYIVRNADTLGVGTDGYSVWGSSAGARMAARIGSYGAAAYGGDQIPGPSTVVMAYTGHADFTASDPPTFAVVGERDGIASPSTMERRATAMRRAGIDVEFRVYPSVGHGFGLGTGTNAAGWLDDAVPFWETHLPPSSGPGVVRGGRR